MVALNVWPTDGADGSVATEARWRKMGRHWAPTGVVPVGGRMTPSLAGTSLTIQDGAAWVDGHYAELLGSQVLTVTANGIAVVRFDPAANTAQLVYRDGVTVPAQSPTGVYEMLIAQITGSALLDRRPLLGPGGQRADFGWVTNYPATLDSWSYGAIPASAFGLSTIIGGVASPSSGLAFPDRWYAVSECLVATNTLKPRVFVMDATGNAFDPLVGQTINVHAFAWGTPA